MDGLDFHLGLFLFTKSHKTNNMIQNGLLTLYNLLKEGAVTSDDILEMADRIKRKPELQTNTNPMYILSSTNMDDRETCLFESNAQGAVIDWDEISMLAYRNGDFDWTNQNKLIAELPVEYQFVRTVTNQSKLIQHLYIKK